ncbi:hypothetical protein K438DRAFT_1623945 [Mycena galopus ATCC 62051]|nr:hypothetical protein K438DRAFT_1623945 [Mycena galopus ATCC 62051]
MAPPPGGGPSGTSGVIEGVHTDEAAPMLSDRVRRRCFNCRTTENKTWRRSILSPGKVLCNKCGLFERSHSRPRPEQALKRGPRSNLRSPSSPQQAQVRDSLVSFLLAPPFSDASDATIRTAALRPPFPSILA